MDKIKENKTIVREDLRLQGKYFEENYVIVVWIVCFFSLILNG